MTKIEDDVARHYGGKGLLERILAGLEAAGADLNQLKIDDLGPVDEFHIGGRKATAHAVAKMSLSKSDHVLDIGCGIGGAARYIAEAAGCSVTGIDLTPEFIEVAESLTGLTGLGGQITFRTGSALAMPFDDEAFDAAITLHVAMNIPERAALYGEIARVMKPGATLCIYDVMKKNDEAIVFPVPWAETAQTSHLTKPEEMLDLLADAGFEVVEVEDRSEFALDFFRENIPGPDGPPPLGVHIVLGPGAPEKMRNLRDNMENGRIAAVQMIARRAG